MGIAERLSDGRGVPEGRGTILRWLAGVAAAIDLGLDAIVGAAVVVELGVLFTNAVGRSFFKYPLDWSLDVAQIALMVIVFLGGAVAYRRQQHVRLRVVIDRLPERARTFLTGASDWVVVTVSLIVAIQSLPSLDAARSRSMTVLPVSQAWLIAPMTIGLLLFAYYGLRRLVTVSNVRTVVSVVTVVLVVALVTNLGASNPTPYVEGPIATGLSVVVFLVMLLAGFPLAFGLAVAAIIYLLGSGTSNLESLPITMQATATGYTLLALPFFIMAGYIMADGGMSRPLAQFARALVGRLPGGLLQVLVVSTFIFSGLSGSKVADIAAVGSATREMLETEGYDRRESAAVLNASAVASETVPPSVALLILAPIVSLPLTTLFVAGVVPAVVISLTLMVAIAIRHRAAHRANGSALLSRETVRTGLRAIPALLLPVILVVGIVKGVATPTEVSSFAVIYGVLVALIVYRKLNARGLWSMVLGAASTAGMLVFIVTTAATFSWTLSIAGVPQALAGPLVAIGARSDILFLIVTIIVMFVFSSVMEGLPAILIFAPLLFPVALKLGVDPMHFAIVFLIAHGLGVFAPPVGVGAYFAANIMDTTIDDAGRRMAGFIVVLLVALLLVAFVPPITLALPGALHLLK